MSNKGIITVFLLIVLTTFMFLTCTLVDIIRIKAFEASAKKITEVSYTSVLANYIQEIKEQYGLYGIYNNEEIEENFKTYLEKNVTEKHKVGFFSMQNIKIEDIRITPLYTLAHNSQIEEQAYKYMKYRGPVAIAEFVKKLTELNKYKETEKIAKQKLNLDKKMRSVSKKIDIINENIKKVNELKENTKEKLIEYCDMIELETDDEDSKHKRELKNDIKNNISEMIEKLEDTVKSIEESTNDIIKLTNNVEQIQENISNAREKLVEGYTKTLENNLSELKKDFSNISGQKTITMIEEGIKRLKNIQSDYKKAETERAIIKINENLEKLDIKSFADKYQNIDASYKELDDRTERESSINSSLKENNSNNKEIPVNIYNLLYSKQPYIQELQVSLNEDNIDMETTLGDTAFEITNKLLRNIYVNEYIMDVFDNQITHKERIGKKDQFFDYEIEYILNGYRSQSDNIMATNFKIYGIRLLINTIHVYTSQPKIQLARTIAIAVGGIAGGGLSIPIIEHAILCGWSATESTYDLNQLTNGREIPLIKTEQNWATQIKGLSETSVMGGNSINLYTSYSDYARLLLLIMDKDEKINRVKDIIKINICGLEPEFELNNSVAQYKIEVDFSINYLFMTQVFIPEEYKKEGRHICKVETYMGY